MKDKEIFEGFSPEQEKEYAEEAEGRWGDTVRQSYQRWNGYTAEQKKQILAEGGRIFSDIAAQMSKGPASPEVQALIGRLQQHMGHFYQCTNEILAGLGQAYNSDPRFMATFEAIDPKLPAFLEQAINEFCKGK